MHSYGWLFFIWSMCKAIAGTDTEVFASRFLKYNCWVVLVWCYLLKVAPGDNSFGIGAFFIIFAIQALAGFAPMFQVAEKTKKK